MELGAKEGSALYPERFQGQQSDTFTAQLHVTRPCWAQTDSLFDENSG